MVLTGAVALFPPAIDMISPVAASAETHNDRITFAGLGTREARILSRI